MARMMMGVCHGRSCERPESLPPAASLAGPVALIIVRADQTDALVQALAQVRCGHDHAPLVLLTHQAGAPMRRHAFAEGPLMAGASRRPRTNCVCASR